MNQKGFSLIETIVAIAILSVYSSIIITLFMQIQKIQRKMTIERNISESIANIYSEILANPSTEVIDYLRNEKHIFYYNELFELQDKVSTNYIYLFYNNQRVVIHVTYENKIYHPSFYDDLLNVYLVN